MATRFAAATETAWADPLAAPCGAVDLVALKIDGVRVGEHPHGVALRIDVVVCHVAAVTVDEMAGDMRSRVPARGSSTAFALGPSTW